MHSIHFIPRILFRELNSVLSEVIEKTFTLGNMKSEVDCALNSLYNAANKLWESVNLIERDVPQIDLSHFSFLGPAESTLPRLSSNVNVEPEHGSGRDAARLESSREVFDCGSEQGRVASRRE